MPNQMPTPQENIKFKKTDIKTKDCYIRSYVRSVTHIKAKTSGTEVNSHIISRDKRIIKYKPKNTLLFRYQQGLSSDFRGIKAILSYTLKASIYGIKNMHN